MSETLQHPLPTKITTLEQGKWWIGKLRADLATKEEQWSQACARVKDLTLTNRELEVDVFRLRQRVTELEQARIPVTFENLDRASDGEVNNE